MKLNRASFYALNGLVHLAEHGASQPVASHVIAKACGIPEKFLLKVLQPLASAGVLLSIRGPHGGYRLARPTTKITLLEVLEAVEGPLRSDAHAIEGTESGPLNQKLEAIAEQAAAELRQQLAGVSLADLAEPPKKTKRK